MNKLTKLLAMYDGTKEINFIRVWRNLKTGEFFFRADRTHPDGCEFVEVTTLGKELVFEMFGEYPLSPDAGKTFERIAATFTPEFLRRSFTDSELNDLGIRELATRF